MSIEKIREAIRDVPDFPKPGILFKDITPALQDPDRLREIGDLFYERYKDLNIDKVACIDARGFIFGGLIATRIGAGLVTVRKAGKLPYDVIEESYELEYGSATLAIHVDAIKKNERVVILDDLLATGGTAAATIQLVETLGGDIVELGFLVELGFMAGRKRLGDSPVWAPIVY
jgi:adenine phosphoribosyltransferase